MNAPRRWLWLLATLLTVRATALAEPPPGPAELDALLRQEPINKESWKKWQPQLRGWSGEHFEATEPAFRAGFAFAKSQLDTKGNLPKALANDAVIWMLLGGEVLFNKDAARAPVTQAKEADKFLWNSIRADDKLARAHYWRGLALRQEQLTPVKDGGPARPDGRRLQDALKELEKARELDPKLKGLSSADMGELAYHAGKLDAAEGYYKTALSDNSNDLKSAQTLAKIFNEHGPFFRKPRAAGIEPLVKSFPNDGVLLSRLGWALVADKRPVEAADVFDRARAAGTDPATIAPSDTVKNAEAARADAQRREAAQIKAEEERRKREEAQKAADEARKKEEARKKAENDKREKEKRAREDAEYARQEADEREQKAFWQRMLNAPVEFAKTVGFWALMFTLFYGTVMASMCLAGLYLARHTKGPKALDLLDKAPHQLVAPGGHVARAEHESWLTRWYGIGLFLALILFYASLPLVFVGLLLVFLLSLVLFLIFPTDRHGRRGEEEFLRASTGGMKAVFKAMFARVGTGSFGMLLVNENSPRFFKAITDVARRVDTEPVDEVWIAPGAEFSVHQEGRGPFGVFGSRKRVLTVGLCVLHYLSISEMQAILAHEYAHFSHADTFWHRFIFQVSLSLRVAMREMARSGGWVTAINPFYWFFFLYSKSYSLLAAGFSRSREFLADRMACSLYGSDVFIRGLIKACTDGQLFYKEMGDKIVGLLKKGKAYVNMYKAFRDIRDNKYSDEERRRMYKRMLDDEPSVFDSHPTFAERLEAAKLLPRATTTTDASSLLLFEEPEHIEQKLTDFFTEVVREA
jgi:Zn-dependent protease with chaperone function/Tfp pilus assembly protein PilF